MKTVVSVLVFSMVTGPVCWANSAAYDAANKEYVSLYFETLKMKNQVVQGAEAMEAQRTTLQSEKKDIKKEIQALKTEISDLTAQAGETQARIAAFIDERRTFRQGIRQSLTTLGISAAPGERVEVVNALDEMDKSLKRQIRAKRDEIQTLNQQIKNVPDSPEVKQLWRQYAQLETLSAATVTKIAQITPKLRQDRRRLERLERFPEANAEEIAQVKQQIQKREQRLARNNQQRDNLEAQRTKISENIEKAREQQSAPLIDQRKKLRAEVAQLREQRNRLQTESTQILANYQGIDDSRVAQREMERGSSDSTAQLTIKKESLVLLRERRKQINAQLKAMNPKYEELATQLQTQEDEFYSARQRNDELADSLEGSNP